MENAKPLSTPLSMHGNLSKDECPKSDNEKDFMSKFFTSLLLVALCTL